MMRFSGGKFRREVSCAVLCRGRLSPVLAARVYTFLDLVWIPRWDQAGTRLAPGSSEQVLKKKPVDLYLCLYYREMSARIQAEQVTQMIFNIYRTDATGWARQIQGPQVSPAVGGSRVISLQSWSPNKF